MSERSLTYRGFASSAQGISTESAGHHLGIALVNATIVNTND
jgi:hypothetical protein